MRIGWVKETGQMAFELDESHDGGQYFVSPDSDRKGFEWWGVGDVQIVPDLTIEDFSSILSSILRMKK